MFDSTGEEVVIMLYRLRTIAHAVWSYLNQSLTNDEDNYSVWRPGQFWYIYRIRHLDNCWLREAVTPAHESGQDEYRTGN